LDLTRPRSGGRFTSQTLQVGKVPFYPLREDRLQAQRERLPKLSLRASEVRLKLAPGALPRFQRKTRLVGGHSTPLGELEQGISPEATQGCVALPFWMLFQLSLNERKGGLGL
jgi:hypothetical protein